MKALLPTRKLDLAAKLRKLTLALFSMLVMNTLLLGSMALAQSDDSASIPSEQSANQELLLTKLLNANPDEAKTIARDIERLWARSGSASADLLLKRGRDALNAKKIGTAIEHLTALTDHAPDFAEGWHMRASAYFHEELYGPAIADLEKTLALNPNHFEAIRGLAAIFEQLGDPKRAYEAYTQVLTIHPHHASVLEALERLESVVKGPAL